MNKNTEQVINETLSELARVNAAICHGCGHVLPNDAGIKSLDDFNETWEMLYQTLAQHPEETIKLLPDFADEHEDIADEILFMLMWSDWLVRLDALLQEAPGRLRMDWAREIREDARNMTCVLCDETIPF